MPTYQRAPKETCDLIANVMEKYHGPKHEAGIRMRVLMAHPSVDSEGDPTGHAITEAGYRALAKIRVLGLKDRVAYGFDAELQLDADEWDQLSDEERIALVDHELTHLQIRVSDQGQVRTDDAGRPILRTAKHDYHFGWFAEIAHRHGEASMEIRQARAMLDSETWKQCWLPGLEPVET